MILGAIALFALSSRGSLAFGIVAHGMSVGRQTVAMDARGDVILAGDIRVARVWGTIQVVKISGATGEVLWTRGITGQRRKPGDGVNAVALDRAGDVVVGGTIYQGGQFHFGVVRLSGRTGARRWRVVLPSAGYDQVTALAVDPAGDVLAGGGFSTGGGRRSAVVKLSGSTGAEEWRNVEVAAVQTLAIDAANDVIAVDATAVKLSAADGHTLWRSAARPVSVSALALDGNDDVVLGGAISVGAGDYFGAMKVSGATGDMIWQTAIVTSLTFWQSAFDIRTDPNGDVVAAGFTADPRTPYTAGPGIFTVAKFAGQSGVERWRQLLPATGEPGEPVGAIALRVDPAGDVVATGTVLNQHTCFDWAIYKLSGATGDVLWSRMVDGTEQTRVCEYDTSDGGPPPGPHVATDQDRGYAIFLDTRRRITAVGGLSDRTSSGAVSQDLKVLRFDSAGHRTR